jgi:hypothetical protein
LRGAHDFYDGRVVLIEAKDVSRPHPLIRFAIVIMQLLVSIRPANTGYSTNGGFLAEKRVLRNG